MKIIGFSFYLTILSFLSITTLLGGITLLKRHSLGVDFDSNHLMMMAVLMIVFLGSSYSIVTRFTIISLRNNVLNIYWPLKSVFVFWKKSKLTLQVSEIRKIEYKHGFRGFDSINFHLSTGNSILIPIDLLYFFRVKLIAYFKEKSVFCTELRLF